MSLFELIQAVLIIVIFTVLIVIFLNILEK